MKKNIIITALIFLGLQAIAQEGVSISTDGAAAHESSMLDVRSNSQGFLPPRMTTAQRNAISNPSEGLTIFNVDNNCLQWFNGSWWYDGCGNNPPAFSPNAVICSTPTTIQEVTSATGRVWMDRNLGATSVATAFNHTQSYGDLYQWGRFTDGHQCRNSASHDGVAAGFATTPSPLLGNTWDEKFIFSSNFMINDWLATPNDNLWQGVFGVNNPCPSGFRIPTTAEWAAETATWSSQDRTGAFNSNLKLPTAGNRSGNNGNLFSAGNVGFYWSSTVNGTQAHILYFTGSALDHNPRARFNGYSVRCIKN